MAQRFSLVILILLTIPSFFSCTRQESPPLPNPAEKIVDKKLAGEFPTNREIIVSIAASTKDVMDELAASFSAKNKITVKLNPGSSSSLATQIIAGAPADLFLSANRSWAEKIDDAGLAESMQPLLTNKLVLIVPAGNPAQIKEPKDLTSDKVKKIALAGEKVPAGIYAEQALKKMGLYESLTNAGKIVRGQDVRNALNFVERGETEAGIVYSTDFGASSKVELVHEFDAALHDEIVYVLVLSKHGSENSAARQFFDFLQSDESRVVFAKAGFQGMTPNKK